MMNKKYLKWAGIAIAIPPALILLLAILLYLPPIQNWAVRHAADYASEKTEMDIQVGKVRLAFPLDLELQQVSVLQKSRNLKIGRDTVALMQNMVLDIRFLPLLRQKVEIDRFYIHHLHVNTVQFIPDTQIYGDIGYMSMEAHGIDWGKEHALIDHAEVENTKLHIVLSDTAQKDTTENKNYWKIRLAKLKIKQSELALRMPGDSMRIKAGMEQAILENTLLDLGKPSYSVERIDWQKGAVDYDLPHQAAQKGIDPGHISVTDLTLRAHNFSYSAGTLALSVDQLAAKEKSGMQIERLKGNMRMDSVRMQLSGCEIQTTESFLAADVKMDLNAFDNKHPGKIAVAVHGHVGKQDLMRFMLDQPQAFRRNWPAAPLNIHCVAQGNMQRLDIAGLNLNIPSAFSLQAKGSIQSLNKPNKMRGTLSMKANTYKVGFIPAMFGTTLPKEINIPSGIALQADLSFDGNKYNTHFTATQGGGQINGSAAINTHSMVYRADLKAVKWPLQHFLPKQGLKPLTADLKMSGKGTDLLQKSTGAQATFRIARFGYGQYDLSQIQGHATVRNGRIKAGIKGDNNLFKGHIGVDALTHARRIRGTLTMDLARADLHRLQLADRKMSMSGCAHIDWATNLKDYYRVQGMVTDIALRDSSKTYRPTDMVLDVLTRKDTTHAVVDCGDFHLNMNARGGYERLMREGNRLWQEILRQYKEKSIDQQKLRAHLPLMDIYLTSGTDNMVVQALNAYGIQLKQVKMDMSISPVEGLNGHLELSRLMVDSILLDTVRFAIVSDSSDIRYTAQVRNNAENPQYTFNSLFEGGIHPKGIFLKGKVYDQNEKLGVSLGMRGDMESNGLRLCLLNDDLVLGYKPFEVNADNFVFLNDNRKVTANLTLRADDGQGVQVYSNDEDSTALQDLTVSLHRFDLEKILSVLPYAPAVKGVMDGDFHAVVQEHEVAISSSISIANMVYEGWSMGNIATEFVYSPSEDGTHKVNGYLYHNDREVGMLDGKYTGENGGELEADLHLDRMPLGIANGFIPDQLFGFKGYADGELSIKGKVSAPTVDGELILDSGYVFSQPYGVEMRFADDPVRIVGSHLLLENFEIFAHNNSPLNIQGSYDFSDPAHQTMNIRMRTKNFLLIDSKEHARSETYGKTYVNFYGQMNGPVEALQMRGSLDVLGSTDMTYILRDSPLSTDNELEELVEFTSFTDSIEEHIIRPQLTGFDMALNIHIDDGAHINCALNAEHSNYLDIVGGGNLRMNYNPADKLQLRGRYTIASGEMKYALPVIPLKNFIIQDGSYIQFDGNPYNPTLNITAKERTKASVTKDASNSQLVNFECGVVITKTLENMGLEFVIDAPEDMTISNQLNTLSKEERGKLAVTMLTTGMYLADGNMSSFSMNSALSSFLQSQINNISGKALRTLDLSIGVDNATTKTGGMQTDYSFKFAKRFWNNRLNIQVGGKVSSGADIENTNQTFFNNVSFDYRLDKNSSKYLKLFYNRDSYDWLEGYVGKYGIGFVWKRRLRHFKDLFRFKDEEDALPIQEDSVSPLKKEQSAPKQEKPKKKLNGKLRKDSISTPQPTK